LVVIWDAENRPERCVGTAAVWLWAAAAERGTPVRTATAAPVASAACRRLGAGARIRRGEWAQVRAHGAMDRGGHQGVHPPVVRDVPFHLYQL